MMRAAATRRLLGALCLVIAADAVTAQHPDLLGFWEPRNGSTKRLAPPALTPLAQQLGKPQGRTPEEQKLAANGIDETDVFCLPAAQPWTLTQSAPIDIVQTNDIMVVTSEARALPWRVYSDGRNHPPADKLKPALNGHSIGRWEGEEFVVDSIGFSNRPGHGPLGELPHNPTLHVTQRFRLQNDGKELVARFTVEDPVLFSTPFVYDFTWYRDPPETYASDQVCDARDPANGKY